MQTTRSNDAYAWSGHYLFDRTYTTNGLNQYALAGTAAFCYDANGNLTADGSSVFLYDVENRLIEKRAQGVGNTSCAALSYGGALQAGLRYDPMGRLYEVSNNAGVAQRFLNDGDALVAEYDAAGSLLRRHVHGVDAKADDPLAWFEGPAFDAASQRQLRADWQGSIVLVTDATGNSVIAANRYDEYGIPQSTNQGRFQYTGQAWIAELGMYYYKARIYSPTLGRFLQTDPIGYDDQVNLYAYVGGDPVNGVDPDGMACKSVEAPECVDDTPIVVTGRRSDPPPPPRPSRQVAEGTGRSVPKPQPGVLGVLANAIEDLICNWAVGGEVGAKVVAEGKGGGGAIVVSYDAASGKFIAGVKGSKGVSGYAMDLKAISFNFGDEARHSSQSGSTVSHSEVSILGTARDGRLVGAGGLKAGFDFSTSKDWTAVGNFDVGRIPGC